MALLTFVVSISFLLSLHVSSAAAAEPESILVVLPYTGGSPLCTQEQCDADGTQSMPSFQCSDSDNWDEGAQTFQDPLPPSTVLIQAEVTVSGRFYCQEEGSDTIVVTLDSVIVKATGAPLRSDCEECSNCASNVTVGSADFSQMGWQGYKYGGDNTLRVLSSSSDKMCLSAAYLRLFYRQAEADVKGATPDMAPINTSTKVTLIGSDFANTQSFCKFGDQMVNATYVSSASMTCMSPVEPEVTSVPLSFSQDGVIFANVTQFSYYVEPVITSFNPTKGSSSRNLAPDVYLTGTGLFNTSAMLCRFDSNLPVRATFINDTTVVCMRPSDPLDKDGRNVTVSFSENGSDFVEAPGLYHFVGINVLPPDPVTPVYYYEGAPPPPPPAEDEPSSGNTEGPIPPYVWVIAAVLAALFVASVLAGILLVRYRNGTAGEYGYNERSPLMDGSGVEIGRDPHSIPLDEITHLELLEKGSFGVIYKARWNGTTIAMKKLPSNNLSDRLLNEFYQEAEIMKSMRHPNVLQYLGTAYAPTGKEVCICMEYMPLGSLYRLIHDPTVELPIERIRSICLDTAKGMSYLHNQSPPIVHRDLKSHNLLVDEHWRVKVCDFGLSRFISQNATMTACGTPSWTAPEVLRNEKYTVKADVYGFGIVVWEMFARDDPFPGMPPFQIVFAVGTQSLRPALRSDWPREWVQLIQDCWNEDSEMRPSFSEVIERLGVM